MLPALYFITLNHTGDTITISVFRRLCTFPLIQRPISRTSLPSVLARPTVRENLMNVTRSYRSKRVWWRSQLGTGRDWHRTVVGLYKADSVKKSDFLTWIFEARVERLWIKIIPAISFKLDFLEYLNFYYTFFWSKTFFKTSFNFEICCVTFVVFFFLFLWFISSLYLNKNQTVCGCARRLAKKQIIKSDTSPRWAARGR